MLSICEGCLKFLLVIICSYSYYQVFLLFIISYTSLIMLSCLVIQYFLFIAKFVSMKDAL